MSTITQHAPGTFCWIELGTTDQNAAKKFYAAVLGWEAHDQDMGNGGTYTLLRLGGDDIAGLYTLRKEQLDHKVPPHWLTYVAVANADESTQKTTQLGGKTLMGPFDVMDLGRMSILQDPTGASFAIWQAKKHAGYTRIGENGAVVWNELLTPDTERAKQFYGGVFGWKAEAMPMPGGGNPGMPAHNIFKKDTTSAAGMMQLTPQMGPMPPNWTVYYAVQDCDATVAKATSLGGKTIVPAQDIPTVGRFAVLADPQGAVFAILKPQPA